MEEINADSFEASVQATTEIRVSPLHDEKLSEGSHGPSLARTPLELVAIVFRS